MSDDCDVKLVDAGSVFGAAWHASANDEVSAARSRSLAQIRRLADGHPRCAICCDSRSNWRKALSPAYKQPREPKPESYFAELERTEEALRKEGLLVWKVEGFEADDLLATAATEAIGMGLRVLIHSSDKDLLQLVRDDAGDAHGSVVVCSVRDGRYYRATDVRDKFGVLPGQMGDWLALVGDTADNIAGVPGVGPKRAAQLLNAFGSIGNVLKQLETTLGREAVGKLIGPACVVSLDANREQLALAQRLVALRTDAPIDFGELFATRVVEPLVEQPTHKELDQEDQMEDAEDATEATLEPQESSTEPVQIPTPRPVQQPSTELALVTQPFELQLEPRSLGAAYKLAQGMMNSRLYSRFGTAEAIWAAIIRGREMGLGALTSLDVIHVIEGKPALHAHLIVARAKALPQCEYFQFVDGDDTFAEYETKHRANPRPTKLRYTIEDAKRAGVCPESPRPRPVQGRDTRSNWEKRPSEMLRKTAAVQLARLEYPQAALGLYAIEELEGAA